MTGRFQGKVAFITGAASGIGRATSITLASQGASLALTDINTAALATLLSDLAATNSQNDHKTYTLDVGNSAACNSVIASAVHDLGHIDFVFNCAGINPTALEITETSDEYFDKLVNTNLRGPYNVTRAVVPHLDRGAAIVNVSSVEGLRVTKEFSIYNATKYGLIGFSKSMALELGPKGIRVNCVAPGETDTPTMAGNLAGGDANEKLVKRIALGRLAQPEEIADVVAFLFSEDSRFMNGSVVEVSGGQGI